ncbi:MAG TPA: hypothetical protein VKP30_17730 [Polyangiaceae bacterium]|nr:hypothetical protein [Polyangiaceae bacterium]
MKTLSYITGLLLVAASAWACATDRTDPGPTVTPNAQQKLVVSGDCDFVSCGVVPSSLDAEETVTCAGQPDQTCAWSGDSGNSSVSYRVCSDSECPAKPAVNCPDGTTRGSVACGSENDGPCVWTTTCTPPRITTPCPEANGCDDLPLMDLAVICSDGSVGGFACVTDGSACRWERNCD